MRTPSVNKGQNNKALVEWLQKRYIAPRIARIWNCTTSELRVRTTRDAGYAVSQNTQERIEEIFGWIKIAGGFRKTHFVG